MEVQIARMVLETKDIDPQEIASQAAAATYLGMTVEGVRSAMDAGRLRTVIIPGKSRRMTLWEDVRELERERGSR